MSEPAGPDDAGEPELLKRARLLLAGGLAQELIGFAERIEKAVDRLTESNVAELAELRSRARHDRRILGAAAIVGFVVVIAAVVLMAVVLVLLGRLEQLTFAAEDERDYLAECTTPSSSAEDPHECFDQAQARTGAVVASIVIEFYDALAVAAPEHADTIGDARDAYLERLDPITG